MSVVLAAEAAPLALLALTSGRLAARLGARRTLLACDALWAPATAAIPLLHLAGALSFAMLGALAFVIGIPAGAHFGAQRAIVPELLGENTADVARANAVFQTASRTTYFAGPAVGGVLLAAAGGAGGDARRRRDVRRVVRARRDAGPAGTGRRGRGRV